MTFFLPFLYLLIGLFVGKKTSNATRIKFFASKILTILIIPIVIIWNLSTNFASMWIFIVGTAVIMTILLLGSKLFSVTNVNSLCFAFLNIGWLGLPVASALFGHEANIIFVGAYIGSSILGNSIGALMLSGQQIDIKKNIITSPVIALVAGILLIPLGDTIKSIFIEVYHVSKILMGLLGMGILGIWLSEKKLTKEILLYEIRLSLFRVILLFIVISIIVLVGYYKQIDIIKNNIYAFYLFCLLPPAATIPALETAYSGTGKSANSVVCGTVISIVLIMLYALVLHFYLL